MDVLEDAYVELAEGRGVSRTRSEIHAPTRRSDGYYGLKSVDAVIPKYEVGVVRITSDILLWPTAGNMRRVNVPSAPGNRYVGLVLLFSTVNGEPLAIFPDGIMQRMRVGATNGLGIKHLARKDANSIGLLGSGWQAGGQLMAACVARSIKTIRCFSPNRERREAFRQGDDQAPRDRGEARRHGRKRDDRCRHRHVRDQHRRAGVLRTMDQAGNASQRHQGRRDRAGGDPPRRPRRRAHQRRAAAQCVQQGAACPHGEAGHGKSKDAVDLRKLPTLWSMLAGQVEKRQSDDEVTCLINAQGIGYQFAAAGWLVYNKAKAMGLGRELPTEWFTEDVPN